MYQYFWDIIPPACWEPGSRGIRSLSLHSFWRGDPSCSHFVLFSLSRIRLFATPWTTAHQASLSFTISLSLLKLKSISQRCHPTISSSVAPPFPLALSLAQLPGLFQWVSSLHQVAKVLELQLQHQSFQWTLRVISFRTDWFDLLVVQETLKSLL